MIFRQFAKFTSSPIFLLIRYCVVRVILTLKGTHAVIASLTEKIKCKIRSVRFCNLWQQ